MMDRTEELTDAAASGARMAAQTDAFLRRHVEGVIESIRAVDEARRMNGGEPGEASPETRRAALAALLGGYACEPTAPALAGTASGGLGALIMECVG